RARLRRIPRGARPLHPQDGQGGAAGGAPVPRGHAPRLGAVGPRRRRQRRAVLCLSPRQRRRAQRGRGAGGPHPTDADNHTPAGVYTPAMRRPVPTPHADKVAALAAQVESLRGQTVHLDKGGVHHFVPLPGDARFRGRKLDVSALREVLAVDTAARVASVEPGVTFAELVAKTLPHGLVPGVVPELTGITVGGAVAGCSVESMSYRVGGFHDTCLEHEVVTGAGEVVSLTPDGDPLGFGMIHGSYGTLGLLTPLTPPPHPPKPC